MVLLVVSIGGSTLNVLADGLARGLGTSTARRLNVGDPLNVCGVGCHPRRLISSLAIGGVLVDGRNANAQLLGDGVGQTTGLEGTGKERTVRQTVV